MKKPEATKPKNTITEPSKARRVGEKAYKFVVGSKSASQRTRENEADRVQVMQRYNENAIKSWQERVDKGTDTIVDASDEYYMGTAKLLWEQRQAEQADGATQHDSSADPRQQP